MVGCGDLGPVEKDNERTTVFEQGELVHDTRYNETFLYDQLRDSGRAGTGHLRKATAEQKEEFDRFMGAVGRRTSAGGEGEHD